MAIHLKFLKSNCRKILYNLGRYRAKKVLRNIEPYLKKDYSILDFGSGSCNILEILRRKNYNVIGIDINNLSLVPDISPVIYCGSKLPFKENQFDLVLIISILHHIPNPDQVLQGLKNVSKKILIVEDIYLNEFHKYLSFFTDSILNQKFVNHPHSNKTDKEWKRLFIKLNLELEKSSYKWWYSMRHAYYYLKK